MDNIIGIGQYAVSNKKEDVLKTYALATCVGITMYCPVNEAGGMIHVALPDHQSNGVYSSKPGYYASLGVPLLLNMMEKKFDCNKKDLIIQLFGGAESINKKDCFHIGKKNLHAITNVLDQMNLKYSFSSVGGHMSRTIEMNATTGHIKMHTQPIKI